MQGSDNTPPGRQAVEITPEMIEAGVQALWIEVPEDVLNDGAAVCCAWIASEDYDARNLVRQIVHLAVKRMDLCRA